VTGQGQPVVLLHGLGTGSGDMVASGLVSRLARRYRVFAFDRPGYGHSDRPRDRVWGPHEQARALREALGRFGVRRPIVVAHSWGAQVALAWALDAPETVSGLVLLSGYLYPVPRADILALSPPVIPGLGDVLRYTILPWVNRLTAPAMVRRMFAPQPVPSAFYADIPLSMMVRPMTIRAIAEEAALMLPMAEMLARRYPQLRLPVMLLAGDRDEVTDPHAHTERFGHDVPGATARLIPGLGHMIHFSAVEAIETCVAGLAALAPETGDQTGPRPAERTAAIR
jgi:pimeloyl-ACP methyl ester carboxylesterase